MLVCLPRVWFSPPLLESVWTYIKVLPFNIQKIESHPQKIIFWKDTSTRDESREMRRVFINDSFSFIPFMPFCNWKMKMMVFYDREECHKSVVEKRYFCVFHPRGKAGWGLAVLCNQLWWVLCASNRHDSLRTDLATCLMGIKAGLPLKVEVWT